MNKNRIKDLPPSERPYEKYLSRGEDALSDSELLAIILRSGVPGINITDICKEIVALCDKKGGIGYLGRVRYDELLAIDGIGKVKAAQIKCLGILCKRMWEQIRSELKSYKSAEDVALFFMQRIKGLEIEETVILLLNARKEIFYEKKMTIGSVDSAILSCREIYKTALLKDAAGIIIMHNHPSGDPHPSTEDKLITQVICKAGAIMEVPLIDHIIIGDNKYYSFKEAGLISWPAEGLDMAYNAFGIDLGTSNIKIYNNSDNSIMNERNIIAIQGRDTLFAYGDAAYEMYEKAPSNITISYPINSGVIAGIHNMQQILTNFINDISGGRGTGADFYISVPTDITEVEKRAFFDLVRDSNLRAKKIMVVEKGIADGLGMGVDVKTSQGVIVVDCGYATTEISILSLGGIVLSKLIKIGGAKFDEDIKNIIRKEFGLVIGEKTAETIRISLNDLIEKKEDIICYGRDVFSGLPVERSIPTDLVCESMREHMLSIVDNVKMILERTPPELSADIYKRGIYVTGGAAMTYDFTNLLNKGTKLEINLSENNLDSAAVGLSKVIKEDKFRSVAYTIEGMSM